MKKCVKKTQKKYITRNSPPYSATSCRGKKRRGNDDKIYISMPRGDFCVWVKSKNQKKSKKKITKRAIKSGITLNELKIMKKKYSIGGVYTKRDIASTLYRVRNNSMTSKDIEAILPLLEGKQRKGAKERLLRRQEHPIRDYKGMWKPLPQPLSNMSRSELIEHIRGFRDAWEHITTRNQDLFDERLEAETDAELRGHLKYYFSEGAKLQAGDWLRDYS